ncbi:MAG: helix-turn-helix domain-containing protein [Parcubacteria group bacterium]|jgi:sugar-specific transcriptional regulator TrmB
MKNKNTTDKVRKALLQLNFTEKEISTYVALLELGASSVQEISRQSGINRVSIYEAIAELKIKGLVSESRRGKKKLFVAEDPGAIMELIHARKAKLHAEEHNLQNAILPLLKAINVRQENKPQIKFFEGAEGINKVYDEYILKNRDVINCGSYETATKVISFQKEMDYFRDIAKRKPFYRMILEDTPLNRKFAEAGKGVTHTKFLPEGTKTSADIVVAGPLLALVSYDKENATLIEDESIAASMKMYLDFMWERL